MAAKPKPINPDAPPDEKGVRVGYAMTNRSRKRLEELATRWETSMTAVVESAIASIANDNLAPVLGGSIMATKQAIHCWAHVIEAATRKVETVLCREEWNYLADVNNGCSAEVISCTDSVQVQTTLLWANAQDGMASAGEWFGRDAEGRVNDLVAKLRRLTFAESWAILLAIQWFWDHCNTVDHLNDRWWSIQHRRQVDAQAASAE